MTNSPPAEFGRFNGGVINLTTKSGSNALRRHRLRVPAPRSAERAEPLRARHGPGPDKPRVPPPPVRRRPRRPDRARTGRSSSPTTRARVRASGASASPPSPPLLQRQGIFTERSAAACPPIFDPATTARPRARRRLRRAIRSPDNTIPAEPLRPRGRGPARSLPAAEPAGHRQQLPPRRQRATDRTSSTLRIDHRLSATDQLFAAAVGCARPHRPRDAASRRQRQPHDRRYRPHEHEGLVAPRSTTSRILRPTAFNELRLGYTQRRTDRRASPCRQPVGGAGPARHPHQRRVLRRASHLRDRRLPAARLAREHVLRLRTPPSPRSSDVFSLQTGRHAFKFGTDWRFEAARHRAAALARPAPSASRARAPTSRHGRAPASRSRASSSARSRTSRSTSSSSSSARAPSSRSTSSRTTGARPRVSPSTPASATP